MAKRRASAAGARAAKSGPSTADATAGAGLGSGARVLVLNATYEPINVCTVRRAAVLVLKEKAEVLEHGERALRSERLTLERPIVIRLISFVRIPRDAHRRKITRKAVLARDSWTCQYCGSRKPGLTVDHVIPAAAAASRSGRTSSPPAHHATAAREIACRGRSRCTRPTGPRAPGPTVFIRIASPTIPPAWHQYLPAVA